MGFFDAFGVEGDTVEIPETIRRKPGNYPAVVRNVRKEEGEQKDGTPWIAMVFEYALDDGTDVEEWFFLPNSPAPWDNTTPLTNAKGEAMVDRQTKLPITQHSQNMRNLGMVKRRLVAIGVPETHVNKVDPLAGDINNVEVIVSMVQDRKTGYVNLKKGEDGVKKRPSMAATLPVAATPAAAPSGFGKAWG